MPEISVANVSDRTFLMHLGGKIEVALEDHARTRDDLSMAYTPGVARVCQAIAEDDPEKVFQPRRSSKNTVAVVTDGTAVSGLGNIGPAAAMPVMEGKAMLFKEFAASTRSRSAWTRRTRTRSSRRSRTSRRRSAASTSKTSRLRDVRDRGTAGRRARHSGLSRRPARDRRRRPRRSAQRAQDRRQERCDDRHGRVNGIGAAGVACTKIVMAAGVTNIIGCDRPWDHPRGPQPRT